MKIEFGKRALSAGPTEDGATLEHDSVSGVPYLVLARLDDIVAIELDDAARAELLALLTQSAEGGK